MNVMWRNSFLGSLRGIQTLKLSICHILVAFESLVKKIQSFQRFKDFRRFRVFVLSCAANSKRLKRRKI